MGRTDPDELDEHHGGERASAQVVDHEPFRVSAIADTEEQKKNWHAHDGDGDHIEHPHGDTEHLEVVEPLEVLLRERGEVRPEREHEDSGKHAEACGRC